jgi:predicted nucleic-acid-binding Zn-ribbon protein
MRDGICPKCGSDEVYSGANVQAKTNSHGMNSIPIRGGIYFAPVTAALDNYVCVKCGYVESYIADPQKLEEIAERWAKVEKEGS